MIRFLSLLILVAWGTLVPAQARFMAISGGPAINAAGGQMIASVSPSSGPSFSQGTAAGTTITGMTTTMSPASPPFSGTYAPSTTQDICTPTNGANNSLIQISGSNLQVSSAGSSQAPGTYPICVIAQQGGISNSPKGVAMTLTISPVTQTIASNSISNNTFVAGSATGALVGVLSTTLSPASPPFAGSYSPTVLGTDGSSFTVAGPSVNDLETNGVLCGSPPCTYSVQPQAIQPGISNSPFSGTVLSITANAPVFNTVALSSTNFQASSPNAVVGSISSLLNVGVSNASYAIVSSGVDHSGTTCTSSNGTNFHIASGTTLETNGTGLAVGSYPGVCVSATQAGVTYVQAFNLTGSNVGTLLTVSFLNNSGSAVPGSVTPISSGAWFPSCTDSPSTCIPAGSHAVPSIGGTTLSQWSASDFALNWPDGSTRWFSFSGFAPTALAANAHPTVTWTLASGAWPSVTPAALSEITGHSHFKAVLTDMTTAYVHQGGQSIPEHTLIGITVPSGSGAVSAANIRDYPDLGYNCNNGGSCSGTVTISGCSGTAPTLTYNTFTNASGMLWPLSMNVTNAGSGCPTVGSGTWTFDVNSILSGISSVPLCTDTSSGANGQICQYAGDNTKDGFQIWGYPVDNATPAWAATTPYTTSSQVVSFGNTYAPTANCTSGTTAPKGIKNGLSDGGCTWNVVIGPVMFRASIEVWKTSGGGIFGFNIAMQCDNGIYKAGATVKNYTFNADLFNGATDLYGAGLSNEGYIGINMWATGAAWFFVDSAGLPFWVDPTSGGITNSAAYNNVIPSLTTSDKVYFHASRAVVPMQQIAMSSYTYPFNYTQDWETMHSASSYVPYCFCGIDQVSSVGNAGAHSWDAPLTDANALHYVGQDHAADGGASTLQSSRVAGLAGLHLLGAMREPMTNNVVDWIPASAWSPPAKFTDPVRPTAGGGSVAGDPTQYDMGWGNDTYSGAPFWDNEHWGNWEKYPYVFEGRRYMLTALDDESQLMEFNEYAPNSRTATLGATTYYSEMNIEADRSDAWYAHSIEPMAVFGGNEADGLFAYQQIAQGWKEYKALYPFTGTYTLGTSHNSYTKSFDTTSNGMLISAADFTLGSIVQDWFVNAYWTLEAAEEDMQLGGSIPELGSVAGTVFNNYHISNLGQSCIYNAFPYSIPWLVNNTTQQPLTTFDATTLSPTGRPNAYTRYGNTLAYQSGSNLFTAAFTPLVPEGWWTPVTAASSGTSLTVLRNTDPPTLTPIVTGSEVYDLTTPSNVPQGTYVTGLTGGTGVTTSVATTVPAPVTTTATANSTNGNFNVTVASTSGIEVGQNVQDTTNNSLFVFRTAAYGYTVASINNVTNVVTLTSQSGDFDIGNPAFCPSNCPNAGDTLVFSERIAFSPRHDYPDLGIFPSSAGTPWPNGSLVFPTSISVAAEAAPNSYQVGPFPFTANVPISEGEAFVWNNVGSSGTQGTLTTTSTASPPNTVVVPNVTGAGQFGWIMNGSACPAPSFGELEGSPGGGYQTPEGRPSQAFANMELWKALNPSSSGATTAINNLLTLLNPLTTTYSNDNKWLLDSGF